MAANEIQASNSYIQFSGMFLLTLDFCRATPSIFERPPMTLYREPTLFDLLNDPIVRLVMKADGVTKSDILDLFDADGDAPAASPPAYICSGLMQTVSRLEA